MDSKILDRVRKLLAKAEDPGATPQEAEAFNAKASQLMAEYGIERAKLAATGQITDKITDKIVSIPAPYQYDKVLLLNTIAQACRVDTILLNNKRLHLFGYESDLERVEVLFTSLLLQATRGVTTARPAGYWENTTAYRKSWLMGFTVAVRKRLQAAEAHAESHQETTGGVSTALVLVDRKQAVSAALKAAYPRVRTSTTGRNLSGSGHSAGYAAGQRADLGQRRVTGNSRALTR